MVNNTIAEITLNYKGNVYSFNYEFGNITADTAKFLFEDGNYACDCNRSTLIQRHCDKNFKELSCGNEIKLDKFKIIKKEN